MSLDAVYILVYEVHGYLPPTPMDKDRNYLKDKYGGSFLNLDGFSLFWDKPKYTLLRDELKNLFADQVLERKDLELWKIIK